MARQLRIEYTGALYHITFRGNAQEAIKKWCQNTYFANIRNNCVLTPIIQINGFLIWNYVGKV